MRHYPVRKGARGLKVKNDELAFFIQDDEGQWQHHGSGVFGYPLQVAKLEVEELDRYNAAMKHRQEFLDNQPDIDERP